MPRLILFDIDETMVSSHGAGRRALEKAMTTACKTTISCEGHTLSGKTDPQIIFEVLKAHGYDEPAISPKLEKIFEVYLPALEREVQESEEYKLHVGVLELIDTLVAKPDAFLGLLTGNIELGARVKLNRFDLNKYFAFGAFGCDSRNRMDLPAVAHKRGQDLFGKEFTAADIVIIGDAQNDVLCAQGYGAKSIAVATGKTTKATLQELKPNHLFDNLANTKEVMGAIFAN